MLPNFLIAGAARSGTTSLYSHLDKHPEAYLSTLKEPHFFACEGEVPRFQGPYDEDFNAHVVTQLSEYEALFEGAAGAKAVGEASVSYLYVPEAAANIKRRIPGCKIIIILRDPVERAFSHWRHHKMVGKEPLGFAEALKKENARRHWRWFYQYAGQGLYCEQVKRYYDAFGPEQVRVFLFGELKEDAAKLMRTLSTFLEIDPAFYADGFEVGARYRSGTPRQAWLDRLLRSSGAIKQIGRTLVPPALRERVYRTLKNLNYDYDEKPSMPPEVRAHLCDFFREDCRALEDLLGRDLSHWQPLASAR